MLVTINCTTAQKLPSCCSAIFKLPFVIHCHTLPYIVIHLSCIARIKTPLCHLFLAIFGIMRELNQTFHKRFALTTVCTVRKCLALLANAPPKKAFLDLKKCKTRSLTSPSQSVLTTAENLVNNAHPSNTLGPFKASSAKLHLFQSHTACKRPQTPKAQGTVFVREGVKVIEMKCVVFVRVMTDLLSVFSVQP